MIFVHGGLNTQIETIERVADPWRTDKLYNLIAREGYYPIFVNWRASCTASYFEQLFLVRQGEKQQVIGPLTAVPTFGVDIARSIARAPLVWTVQTRNDFNTTASRILRSKVPDEVAKQLICAYEYEDAKSDECLKDFSFQKPPACVPLQWGSVDGNRKFDKRTVRDNERLSISVDEDQRTCAESDLSLSMYFLTLPSRLLIEPVVDAFGTSAWDNMLRETRLLFNVDDEFTEEAAKVDIPRAGGLSIFLQRLQDVIEADKNNGDGRQWEIALIGHSMGTIIINQMLRESIQLKHELPIKNIVYMSAAASMRDVQDSVLPYLRNNPYLQECENEKKTQDDKECMKTQFYNLMLHHIAEEHESYNLGQLSLLSFDPGPRGSLLVMIDNFLSKPLTYLDRTAGRYDNFMPAVHDFPKELWPQMHIKTFSAGEKVKAENPQRHSEFTERFRFWIEDCWRPVPAMGGTTLSDCIHD